MATITRRLPDRARKNQLTAKWKALVAYCKTGYHSVMLAFYAIERHTRPSGNPRSYRVEDLSEDQANEILKAIQQQKLETTQNPDRLLK